MTKPIFRAFDDTKTAREWVFDGVQQAAANLPPVSNNTHSLAIQDVHYAPMKPVTPDDEKLAVLQRQSITRPLRGTWVLTDNATGEVVDSKKTILAHVPHMLDSGAFMRNGNKIMLRNQSRLRPGIFARRKENGEIEAHVNVQPQDGQIHRYHLDPSSGVFNLVVGQAKAPLYVMLKALGASDPEIRDAWGQQVWEANKMEDHPRNLLKIYERFAKGKDKHSTAETQYAAIRERADRINLDPVVSQATLGYPAEKLTYKEVLQATKNLLAISKGERDPDDRDNIAFQTFHSPEDVISERIRFDYGNLRRQLLWKAAREGSLGKVSAGALNPQIHAAFLQSGLAQDLEDVNASDSWDKNFSITRLGEGAMPSVDIIPLESRAVQNSQMNFIDPIRTPECYDGDMEVFTHDGWKAWKDVTETDYLAVNVAEAGHPPELAFAQPDKLTAEPYTGNMYHYRTPEVAFRVTMEHRMYCRPITGTAWSLKRINELDTTRTYSLLCEHTPLKNSYASSGEIKVYDGEEYATYSTDEYAVCAAFIASERYDAAQDVIWLPSRLLSELEFSQFQKVNSCAPRIRASRPVTHPLLRVLNRRGVRQWMRLLGPHSLHMAYRALSTDAIESDKEHEVRCHLATLLGIPNVNGVAREAIAQVDWSPSWGTLAYVEDHMVYCATVPGGMLFVRGNDTTAGFWCGNSMRGGVDLYFSSNARKGRDNQIYAPFIDPQTNKEEWLRPSDIMGKTISTLSEWREYAGKPLVPALSAGEMQYVSPEEVNYLLPDFESAFSPLSQTVPLKSTMKGHRLAMASRMLVQSLPLSNGEAPLVQTALNSDPEKSYHELFGTKFGAIRSEKGGSVVAVDDKSIQLRFDDGTEDTVHLATYHPNNRKTYLHQTPVVKPGQRIEPGMLIAKSNQVDNTGALALGLNARVAFMPWKGLQFEDAITVSESFANRAKSQHMYQTKEEWDDSHIRNKAQYITAFPKQFNSKQLENIDNDGLIRVGSTVNYGDPLALATKQRTGEGNRVTGKFSDAALTWDHHDPGIVTDVYDSPKGTTILVRNEQKLKLADKLSARQGNKGVISSILPDEQMPILPDGQPAEVVMSSFGLASRVNPSQIAEMILGKIAAKRGKPYKMDDFNYAGDIMEFITQEAEKYGVDLNGAITDPESGKEIRNEDGTGIMHGNMWLMKLHHQAESKGSARSFGGYTQTEAPSRGGKTGSKRVALQAVNALVSHGAYGVLKDSSLIKGQRNDDFWMGFMAGKHPRPDKVPLSYQKFIHELQASGIHVLPKGGRLQVMAMTNDVIDDLAGKRTVKNSETLNLGKDNEPIPGGLFDPKLFGVEGNKWAAIELTEPILNPVMEEPTRKILELTEKQLNNVLAGKENYKDFGTGSQAIQRALSDIDLEKRIRRLEEDVRGNRKTIRDKAIKQLVYLKKAQALGLHPKEWMIDKIPVLPPKFRPITEMAGSRVPLVADANYLYKLLVDTVQSTQELKDAGLPYDEEQQAVFQAFKEVTGLTEPAHPKLQQKKVRGLLKNVFGKGSSKYSTVQRQLLGSAVDLIARGVVTPNPDFDMDTIGIPENSAWEIYKPFVIRRLVQRNYPLPQAQELWEKKSGVARQELVAEMGERPVIVDRAPIMHKYGIMAFNPVLVKGEAIQTSPLIVAGFGMDYDGDTSNFQVPVLPEAVEEARSLMMPSQNLISPSDFKSPLHTPGQDAIAGLYYASKKGKGRPRTFATQEDVVRAYKAGEIDIDDQVIVLEGDG